MCAGDAHQGAVKCKNVVTRFEHKAHIVQQLVTRQSFHELHPDEPVPAPDADTPREYHTIEVVHYSGDATKTDAQCN